MKMYGLLVLLLFAKADGFKYLMYNPVYAPSHILFADKIVVTLREAGHTVVQVNSVQTTNFDLKKLDHHKDNWIRWPKTVEAQEKIASRLAQDMWESDGLSFKELLKADYDVCGLGLFEKLGIKKFVAFTPFPLMLHITEAFGIPSMTSHVPDLSTVSSPEMSFLTRAGNFLSPWIVGAVSARSLVGYTESVIRELVDSNFNALERCAEASYMFTNSDAVLEFGRPTSEKMIHIGGLGISDKNVKPLDAKFQKIVDNLKDGLVVVSFGTITQAHQIPHHIKLYFLEAFAEFPNYTFLWKYEKPEHNIAANYSNVVDIPWLPQRDLFAHPKVRGFITHGGLNSILEAAYAGIPLISIGLFGDQQRNGKMAEYRGYGIYLDKRLLSKEMIVEKLRELLGNEKYHKKAVEISRMLKDKPHSAEEVLVKYVEFATKFDVHPYLDMYGRHLSLIQYHSLDVAAFILLLFTSILVAFYLSFKILIKLCRSVKRKIE